MSYKYPCTAECKNRTLSCHDSCKEYLEVKANNELVKENRRLKHELNGYRIDKKHNKCKWNIEREYIAYRNF